jgi:glutathione S-transferase
MPEITLYGSSLSLFTGRARSYLIKAGLPYRERVPVSQHYFEQVLPKMGGRRSVPVIETETGEVIRDGAAIIDHYEEKSSQRFSPSTPKQKTLSLLFDVIGTEGLLRPAMHYRWNFPEENLEFLTFHFERYIPPNLDKREMAEKQMNRMRNAGETFGAVPATFELVESLYCALIEKLDRHFAGNPYLFGGKPSIGDFGMIAPLFAHLGRDPKSIRLMQTRAIRLFRWVERMNRPEPDIGEYDRKEEDYLPDDEIPQTLIEVLQHIAIDFIPETGAAAKTINDWLEQNKKMAANTTAERQVGIASFQVADTTVNAIAQPYRFYLLSRMQNYVESLAEDDKKSVLDLLQACGMAELMKMRLSRDIGRHENREVWL